MIQLANRFIICPSDEAVKWAEENINPHDVIEFDQTFYHNSLDHIPAPGFSELPKIKIGKLHWPSDASRFAVGYFLADDDDMAVIGPLAFGNSGPLPITLVMDERANASDTTLAAISTTVYLLPPRPLAQTNAGNGLWLLTVVDQRYFWWYKSGDVVTASSYTTLITNINSILGATMSTSAYSGDFDPPSNRFNSRRQPLPQLLDAAARAAGMRVSAQLDGSIDVNTYADDLVINSANLALIDPKGDASKGAFIPLAGGVMNADGIKVNQFVPSSVDVVFSVTYDGVYNVIPYVINQTLTGLALSNFSGVTGFTGTKILMGDLTAVYVKGVLQNSAALTAYAVAAASAWYQYQLSTVDQVLSGIANWSPNGLNCAVEWTYRKEMCCTRVMRNRWNDRDWGKPRLSTREGLPSVYPEGFDDTCNACAAVPSNCVPGLAQILGKDVDGCWIWYSPASCGSGSGSGSGGGGNPPTQVHLTTGGSVIAVLVFDGSQVWVGNNGWKITHATGQTCAGGDFTFILTNIGLGYSQNNTSITCSPLDIGFPAGGPGGALGPYDIVP